MFHIISILLAILFIGISILMSYQKRNDLKLLPVKDLLQFVFATIFALAFLHILIYGGLQFMHVNLKGMIATLLKLFAFIFILYIATCLYLKLLPDSIKHIFYRKYI